MKLVHYRDVPAEEVTGEAEGVTIRWLIDENDGAKTFVMRHFETAPGGHTPHHTHDWEHEVFILAGSGVVVSEDGDKAFEAGDVVFIPGGEKHQFKNTGPEPVEMLCLIPARN